MAAPQSDRKFHSKYKGIIQKYGDKITIHLPLVFLFPLLLVLIHSIYWPGPLYCSDSGCPSSDPSIPDAALLVVGKFQRITFAQVLVLVIYFYVLIVGIGIIGASGSWMSNSIRNKLTIAFLFMLGSVSIVQLVSPIVLRTLVYPYYRVNSYNINVTLLSNSSASIQFNDYYSPILNDVDFKKVFVQVNEASGDERSIDDLSPYSRVIYRDHNYESCTPISKGMSLTRTINHLVNNKWYLFMVIPATKESSGGHIFEDSYYSDSLSTNLTDGTVVNGIRVDLRAFKLCKWSESGGCQQNYH